MTAHSPDDARDDARDDNAPAQPDSSQSEADTDAPPSDGGTSTPQARTVGAATPPAPRRTGVFVDPRDLRSHVSDLLRAIVGTYRVDPYGNFSFDHESTRAFVTVTAGPFGPVVGVFSVLATSLELTEDLAAWMATTNHKLLFGSLSWDAENKAVWLRHNLLGSHLDEPELGAALQAVVRTADQLDDVIVQAHGGQRHRDRVQEHDPSDDADSAASQEDPDDELRPPNASGYL